MLLKNIFVQVLPIWKEGKVLLVQWSHGQFKNRFTGLIKSVELELEGEPTPKELVEKHLKPIAHSMIPFPANKMDLKAILEFPDPPGYTEYVFLASLQTEPPIKQITFDDSPCTWFPYSEIPFAKMPEDDEKWYPQVLQERKSVRGSFTFGSWEETKLQNYWVKEVDKFW